MAYEKMRLQEACSRCLLCSQAACQQAYGGKTDLPGVIRSIRFDNYEGALAKVAGRDPEKERKAMQACRRRKIDRPVPITEILDCLQELAGSGEIPEPDRQETRICPLLPWGSVLKIRSCFLPRWWEAMKK